MGLSSSPRRSGGHLRHLPPPQRRALLEAAVLLPVVDGLLRLAGYQRAMRVMARVAPLRGRAFAGDDLAEARATAHTVAAVARRLHLRCLPRSLTLWSLLRLRGIETELRMGVRKGADEFEAHAWVECHGSPLHDAADVGAQFQELHQPPRSL